MRMILALSITLTVAGTACAQSSFQVLVFSKTTGFRHDSIANGIQAIQELGAEHDFDVVATEDSTTFTDAGLAPYRVVVFLCTTGEVLNAGQQSAFERYIQDGGGWAGIHSAADTEYDWPFYGSLLGAYFQSHPAIQQAAIDVADAAHPSTSTLPARWQRTDEWYNFQTNPRPQVQVLLTLDETSYDGGEMGADHPVSWAHELSGGRAWYTALGHTGTSWSEPLFRAHVLGGIQWAAGPRIASADPRPPWLPAALLAIALAFARKRKGRLLPHPTRHNALFVGVHWRIARGRSRCAVLPEAR